MKSEQDRIECELQAAQRAVAEAEIEFIKIEDTLRRCLAFLADCHRTYAQAPAQLRRRLNQAVFERFLVGPDGSTRAEPT